MSYPPWKKRGPYFRIEHGHAGGAIREITEPFAEGAGVPANLEGFNLPQELIGEIHAWNWNLPIGALPDKAYHQTGYRLASRMRSVMGFWIHVEYQRHLAPFRLEVAPDLGCGLWVNAICLELEDLDPPSEMVRVYREWLDWYEKRIDPWLNTPEALREGVALQTDELGEFADLGREIAEEIKGLLGDEAVVFYYDEYTHAGADQSLDGPPPEMEPIF